VTQDSGQRRRQGPAGTAGAGVRLATGVPDLTPLGGGLLATGAVLIAAAFALIYFGAAGLGRRHTAFRRL
jgi:hypothetical protein